MGDKVKYRSTLTDEGQREAQLALLNQVREGNPDILRSSAQILQGAQLFNPLAGAAGNVINNMLKMEADTFLPGDALARYRAIAEGKTDPLSDDSGLFGAMVKNVENAGTRAREAAMAAGSKFGNQFGSASRAAGIAAETEGNVAGKARIAELLAARQAQRVQFQFEAANMLAQAAKWAVDSKLTASQIKMAADQWAKGMSYQEWARLHPTVAQLAEVIYGKNIDTIAEKKKNWLGPALVGVAGLVASIATGGAAAPAALAAFGAAMNKD